MKKVSDKFDSLDDKLDDLETKRGQLRQVLCRMCVHRLFLHPTSHVLLFWV